MWDTDYNMLCVYMFVFGCACMVWYDVGIEGQIYNIPGVI